MKSLAMTVLEVGLNLPHTCPKITTPCSKSIGVVTARYVDERVDECAESCLNDCEAMEFTSAMKDSGVTAERDDIGNECELHGSEAPKTAGHAFEGQDFSRIS